MQKACKALAKNQSNKDDRRAIVLNSRNSELDKEEVSSNLKQYEYFLDLALRYGNHRVKNSDACLLFWNI